MTRQPDKPEPHLLVDDHDLSERIATLDIDHVRTGVIWTHDEVRSFLWGHEHLPMDPHTGSDHAVRVSQDGLNWYEGKMRVSVWQTDGNGTRLEMIGRLEKA